MIGSININTVLKEVEIKNVSTRDGHLICDCYNSMCPVVTVKPDYDRHDYNGSTEDGIDTVIDRLRHGHSPGSGIDKCNTDPTYQRIAIIKAIEANERGLLKYLKIFPENLNWSVLHPGIFIAIVTEKPDLAKENKKHLKDRLMERKENGGSSTDRMLYHLDLVTATHLYAIDDSRRHIGHIFPGTKKPYTWQQLLQHYTNNRCGAYRIIRERYSGGWLVCENVTTSVVSAKED